MRVYERAMGLITESLEIVVFRAGRLFKPRNVKIPL
jgi:hypothetical protein